MCNLQMHLERRQIIVLKICSFYLPYIYIYVCVCANIWCYWPQLYQIWVSYRSGSFNGRNVRYRIWIFFLDPWTILDGQSVFRQSPFPAESIKIPVHGSLMASLCQERLRDITCFPAGFSSTNQPELILQHFCRCVENQLLRLHVTVLPGDL